MPIKKKLQHWYDNITFRWFLENAISFSSSTLFVYILSVVLVPYLYTTLGNDTFGVMNFARSTAVNLMMFAGAGLGFAGIKEWREKDQKHNTKLFWNLFLAKIILSIFSILLILSLYLFGKLLFNLPVWDKIVTYKSLIIVYLTWAVTENFISQWPFTASKNMRYMIFVNLIFKTFYAVTAFRFVKSSADVLTVAILLALSSLGIFISTQAILIRKKIINLPDLKEISIKEAWELISKYYYLMLQKIGASIMLDLPLIFVGAYASDRILGLFSLARKIFDVMQSILKVLSKSIFVILDNAYKKAIETYTLLVKKLIILYSAITTITGIGLIMIYGIFVILIKQGIHIKQLDLESLNFIAILTAIFYLAWILAQIVDIIGLQSLLVKGKPKEYGFGWFITSLSSLPIIFILSKYFLALGGALSIVIAYALLILIFLKLEKNTFNAKNRLVAK